MARTSSHVSPTAIPPASRTPAGIRAATEAAQIQPPAGRDLSRSMSRPAIGFGFQPMVTPDSVPVPPTSAKTPSPVASRQALISDPTDSREIDEAFSSSQLPLMEDADRDNEPSSSSDVKRRQQGDGIQMERIQDEYGGELIEGTIRVVFEPGQKRAHLHVPFNPPLPGVPEVEVEAVGDEDLRLKVAVRQSYGIRIEARRTETADRLVTDVGFAAVCSNNNRR